MVACILTGHGAFAEGVGGALEMVGGPQPDFSLVTFCEDEAAEFPARLSAAIADASARCGEVVVFCDLLGGTPFNQAMLAAAQNPAVRVVTGANLPMLLECMSVRSDGASASQIVETALEIGRMGIAAPTIDSATSSDEDDLDGEGI